MLKKSLICVAILAIAMPAFAADTFKFHGWESTTTYNWNDICTMDVVMDVGYWINIDCEGDIEVQQDSLLGDPFYSYSGCSDAVVVKSNFLATLKATAASASAAGGSWSATIDGAGTKDIAIGTTSVTICVAGTGVEIDKLTQADNVKVAVVTISVLPTSLI